MTKKEYIESNKYLRKGINNLSDSDLILLSELGTGKINLHDKNNILKIKQLMFHMQSGMTAFEKLRLVRSFKILLTLPD